MVSDYLLEKGKNLILSTTSDISWEKGLNNIKLIIPSVVFFLGINIFIMSIFKNNNNNNNSKDNSTLNNNNSKKKIVVIGGGFAGITLASVLDKNYDLTIIERNNSFFHYIASLRSCVDLNIAKTSFFKYDKLLKKGKFVNCNATEILENKVVLEGGVEYPFDFLVIATGANNITPFKAPSDSTNVIQYYQSIQDKIKEANHILIVGGGAVGVEMAGEIASEFPGKNITLVSRGPCLVSRELPEKFLNKLNEKLKNLKINVMLNTKLEIPDDVAEARNSQSYYEYVVGNRTLNTSQGDIQADLVFWTIGNKPNNELLLGKLPLDESGYLKVNESLQVEGFDNVFGCGDISNIKERRTVRNTYNQSLMVAKNIEALSKGKQELSKYQVSRFYLGLTIGRNEGIAMLPNGWMIPDFICRMASRGGLGVKTTAKFLNYPEYSYNDK